MVGLGIEALTGGLRQEVHIEGLKKEEHTGESGERGTNWKAERKKIHQRVVGVANSHWRKDARIGGLEERGIYWCVEEGGTH